MHYLLLIVLTTIAKFLDTKHVKKCPTYSVQQVRITETNNRTVKDHLTTDNSERNRISLLHFLNSLKAWIFLIDCYTSDRYCDLFQWFVQSTDFGPVNSCEMMRNRHGMSVTLEDHDQFYRVNMDYDTCEIFITLSLSLQELRLLWWQKNSLLLSYKTSHKMMVSDVSISFVGSTA